VIAHVAAATQALPLAQRILVAAPDVPGLPGFTRVALEPPDAPQSRSLALGLAAVGDAQAVLIALADMPLVPPAHFARMLALFDGDRLTSACEGQRLPPRCWAVRISPPLALSPGIAGPAPCCATRRPCRSRWIKPWTSTPRPIWPARNACWCRPLLVTRLKPASCAIPG
jgi:CTP:molybdopterin cytidylyltransferase MocA